MYSKIDGNRSSTITESSPRDSVRKKEIMCSSKTALITCLAIGFIFCVSMALVLMVKRSGSIGSLNAIWSSRSLATRVFLITGACITFGAILFLVFSKRKQNLVVENSSNIQTERIKSKELLNCPETIISLKSKKIKMLNLLQATSRSNDPDCQKQVEIFCSYLELKNDEYSYFNFSYFDKPFFAYVIQTDNKKYCYYFHLDKIDMSPFNLATDKRIKIVAVSRDVKNIPHLLKCKQLYQHKFNDVFCLLFKNNEDKISMKLFSSEAELDEVAQSFCNPINEDHFEDATSFLNNSFEERKSDFKFYKEAEYYDPILQNKEAYVDVVKDHNVIMLKDESGNLIEFSCSTQTTFINRMKQLFENGYKWHLVTDS